MNVFSSEFTDKCKSRRVRCLLLNDSHLANTVKYFLSLTPLRSLTHNHTHTNTHTHTHTHAVFFLIRSTAVNLSRLKVSVSSLHIICYYGKGDQMKCGIESVYYNK